MRVALGDVCAQSRLPVRPGEGADLPYLGLEGIEAGTGEFTTGELSKTPDAPAAMSFRFDERHVLYGKLRPYLNKVALPNAAGKCSTEIIPLLPSERLDRRYLAYFLRTEKTVAQIAERSSGARMPRADMDFVLSLQVELPSLEVQRTRVDLLTRAEGIVRLRREAQRKAAELIPAIFIDMFGDPAVNPKGWPVRRLGDVVSRFEGGKNLKAGAAEERGYRILKISAVTSGQYDERESKPTPDGYVPPPSHVVQIGDLLFSRANTVDLVGATAIVESTSGRALLPDKLWRFHWREATDARFMLALLQTAYVRAQLSKLATGTSDSMRNISQAKLVELMLPIPDLEEQRAFGAKALAVNVIRNAQLRATSSAEAAFNALLAQAFTP